MENRYVMALRSISLCSGVGGLDLGTPARPVCYVEGEAYAAAILASRMEDGFLAPAPIWSDIRTFDARPWRRVLQGGVVTGGYPCQPFSHAGARRGADDPRHLWPHVLRVLVESEALFGFFENVRGHVSKGLREVLQDLARVGFNAEWDVFSAEEEGAPHRRERLFVFAYRPCSRFPFEQGWDGFERPERVESEGAREADAARYGEDWELAGASGARLVQRKEPRQSQESQFAGKRWWAAEPDVGRVAHGVAARVDRLRACGNGVVPAVAARAWSELTRRAGVV